MKRSNSAGHHLLMVSLAFFAQLAFPQAHVLTVEPELQERTFGPYDVHVLEGGKGLTKPLSAASKLLTANAVETISAWVFLSPSTPQTTLLAGLGDPTHEDSRLLGLQDRRAILRFGKNQIIAAARPFFTNGWHFLAVTFDSSVTHLFADGVEVASAPHTLSRVDPILTIAPAEHLPGEPFTHFGGVLAQITVTPDALAPSILRVLGSTPPDTSFLRVEEASQPWPIQTRQQGGYLGPQDPALMPHSRAPLGRPIAQPVPPLSASALTPCKPGPDPVNCWTIARNWSLTDALDTTADGPTLSLASADTRKWLRATIPGTVLTSMIDRGVYPDSDFGLNNLAIPETLNKQSYWYRVEFESPSEAASRHLTLTFNGINYAAQVWLNGHFLGNIRGAFIRGSFDVSAILRPEGHNALAVLIQPPPHPGIPQEQSVLGGPGENGGALSLDGPTFVATEGWDWIPAIRDRNMGIWQDVVLSISDHLQLGDPQIVTRLPLPDISTADVEISVPLRNLSTAALQTTLHVTFEGVDFTRTITAPPGNTNIKLTSADAPQLHLSSPRLWWPNGYGRPDLYHLTLSIADGPRESDRKTLTFGVREISYELSLFDHTGRLRRAELFPTIARGLNQQVLDVTHEGLRSREAEFYNASLTPVGESSPAVVFRTNEDNLTDLILKVNGVRIAARGGNWGMDDSRKRVSRAHLEPFFRLHREANVNIIRNWVGQNTEETFFQLADEYGMMVWNDFWSSTQDYNVEPQDVPLFLANARDVVARFRNHPSIVVWCGRNEGVPQPILNEGLINMIRDEDGTRYYTPGSNRIGLRNSGPYSYQEPDTYYTRWDKGFSVELGVPSPSTLEAFRASLAPADLWPIGDAWAYHDWHQSGNGRIEPFMRKIEQEFGAGTSLEDFERKAQMLSYNEHRAIFEGFNQHLWKPNSARLLWMTQPAWPSNMWQIFNSDYDTPGSFYGVKKACEPLHVQLDLSDYTVAAVNTTATATGVVTVRATVFSLTNQLVLTREGHLNLGANQSIFAFQLALSPLFTQEGVILVKLEMLDATGKLLSDNFYWLAGDDAQYRKLNTLPKVRLTASATTHSDSNETVIDLKLANPTQTPALATKVVLLNPKTDLAILPAYFSENYVTLLPGEARTVVIHYPKQPLPAIGIALRGWNIDPSTIAVSSQK